MSFWDDPYIKKIIETPLKHANIAGKDCPECLRLWKLAEHEAKDNKGAYFALMMNLIQPAHELAIKEHRFA